MKISVITVCLNSAATIGDTIESVLAQDHPDIEHIIVDGASTDGTMDVVRRYGDRIAKVVSEPDRGMYDSANKGLRLATGDVVGMLNSDDFYAAPDVLSTMARTFVERDVDVVHGDLDFIDPQDVTRVTRRFRSREFQPGDFRRGWHPAHPTFYVRRKILLEIGGFDEDLFAYGDDAELGLRARIAGWGCRYMPQAWCATIAVVPLGCGPPRLFLIERNRVLLAVKLFPGSLLWQTSGTIWRGWRPERWPR